MKSDHRPTWFPETAEQSLDELISEQGMRRDSLADLVRRLNVNYASTHDLIGQRCPRCGSAIPEDAPERCMGCGRAT